jgi:hypothetical protein
VVLLRPLPQAAHRLADGRAERRERVLDTRGHFGEDGARDESVPFEIAERLRQHFLTDAADGALQVGEAARLAIEGIEDHERPLVGDGLEDIADLLGLDGTAGRVTGHVTVTRWWV